jgi:polar amino acid transport system substrate-binding protein
MRIDRRGFGRLLLSAGTGLLLPVERAAAAGGMSPDIQAIKDRGQLIVGMTDFDSAPFYFSPPGSSKLDGWDVQLAKDLAGVLEVKPVFDRRGSSYNAIVDELANGAIDIAISKLSVTPRRAMRVQFTRPTIELRHALLANRVTLAKKADDSDLRAVLNRDFDGRIGVIAKSSYADVAKQVFAHADLREFNSWEEVVSAVAGGDVDLAYRDELEVKKLMRLRPDLHLNLRSVLITDIRDAIAVALPNTSLQLLALVDVLLSQRQKFEANQLLDAYPDVFKS